MSKSVTPKLQKCARRLLAYEAAVKPTAVTKAAAFRVCEKLRRPLTKVMGTGGFHSLLSRALVIASAKVPWLLGLRIDKEGSLQGLDEVEGRPHDFTSTQGELLLVSQLLGLLVTFIGATSTLRLLNDIWPRIDDLTF
jgi:hypothetical protein